MADTPILAHFRPGDLVRYAVGPPFGPWVILKVCVDGSLLLRQGAERRIADPKEVRR